MVLTSAPYFAEIAQGPAGGEAHWLTTADNVRIRIGHWTAPDAQPKGTILLFPGRTEYIEKYGPTAADLTRLGYHVVTVDWRGQGLADRKLADRRLGHVDDFAEYQCDVDALVTYCTTRDLPKPHYLIAHSMGGAIALRSIMEGLDIQACAFTAPMWGIRIPPALKPFAAVLVRVCGILGLDHKLVPTTHIQQYVQTQEFDANTLTGDADMYAFLQMQMRAEPELALGGPTLRWLAEALRETKFLAMQPTPDLPCLTFLGTDEQIVNIAAIEDRMARWPNATLEHVPHGRHEILMETLSIRAQAIAQIDSFFAQYQ